jgi:adenosine deaminase
MTEQAARRNILLCTLGASWAVVPEVLGFVAPRRLPLYRDHPRARELAALREHHGLLEPDELWLVTTGGHQTAASLKRLEQWWALLGSPLPLRAWVAEGTDQLATPEECASVRELTLRATLLATERAAGGQLLLSLAGGRKTMSADLQLAGTLFGAHAWLHVVGPEPLPAALARDPEPALFTAPLPAGLAGAVTPLVVGRGQPDEAMQVPLDGRRIDSARFPLPPVDGVAAWGVQAGMPMLAVEVERRQREGSRLLGNFLSGIARDEMHPNWRALFRLPPRVIEALRARCIDGSDREWLRELPKVDLHRHLGGCLDLAAQRLVGLTVWDALDASQRREALSMTRPLLEAAGPWPWDWPQGLRGPLRPAATAALLVHADDAALERNLHGVTQPRLALRRRSPFGFAAYERPGELSGSALLSHEAALEPYAEAVVAAARAEGLVAMELRGSPQKYLPQDPALFVSRLRAALRRAGARVGSADDGDGPRVGFVWILDRRQQAEAPRAVAAAVRSHDELEGFVVGLDLAGDEGTSRPHEWAAMFGPAFRECLFVTIHAGEDEPAENIWQAAYELHADRIGHGLSLHDNRRLMERFRERGICLELCPTSNLEVVGFRDEARPETADQPAYPLRNFLGAGLPVTLCTDNPGISRTTLADEYVAASRMTPGGLTRWEALGLIRQGFVRSFLPAPDRRALVLAAEEVIARKVLQKFTDGS